MENMNIRVAIVDDEQKAIDNLVTLLKQYENENGVDIAISTFNDSAQFVFEYKPIYDLIFLDVQMPKYNGLQVAEEIRKKDADVFLIFQTTFGQFALHGYQYDAMDYFVKPVTYQSLRMRLSMVKKKLSERGGMISFPVEGGGIKILKLKDILYVEESGRNQVFHTVDGEEFINIRRESLSSLEKKIGNDGFARCNSGFILNLKKCSEIKKNVVSIGGVTLEISRTYRQSFMEQLFKATKEK